MQPHRFENARDLVPIGLICNNMTCLLRSAYSGNFGETCAGKGQHGSTVDRNISS